MSVSSANLTTLCSSTPSGQKLQAMVHSTNFNVVPIQNYILVSLQTVLNYILEIRTAYSAGQITLNQCNSSELTCLQTNISSLLTSIGTQLGLPNVQGTSSPNPSLVMGSILSQHNLMGVAPELINPLIMMSLILNQRILVDSWDSIPVCKILLYADPVLLSTTPEAFQLCGPTATPFALNPITTIPLNAIDMAQCSVSSCGWLSQFDAHNSACPTTVPNQMFEFPPNLSSVMCGSIFGLSSQSEVDNQTSSCQAKVDGLLSNLKTTATKKCCITKKSVAQTQWLRWLVVGIGVVACIVLLITVIELFKRFKVKEAQIKAAHLAAQSS